MLKVKNLNVTFSNIKILEDINFYVKSGDWLMIMGPNGSGKTTITNAIAQSIDYQGLVFLEGNNVKTMTAKERAEKIGILMQNHNLSYSFKVEDIVKLGRYSHGKGIFKNLEEADEDFVERALEKTGMKEYAKRSVLSLSGGEIQRTFLAQVFAQNPKLMILDEPTNHLDIVYQEQVFNTVRDWLREGDRAVVSVVHDLPLARAYGNKGLLLKEGRVYDWGDIDEVLSRENLRDVYNIDIYQWLSNLHESWII